MCPIVINICYCVNAYIKYGYFYYLILGYTGSPDWTIVIINFSDIIIDRDKEL